jgi:hypothetical protein
MGGFSQKQSRWDIRTFRFQKNAKASFCTPKPSFSTAPKDCGNYLALQEQDKILEEINKCRNFCCIF